jgi:septin family protein
MGRRRDGHTVTRTGIEILTMGKIYTGPNILLVIARLNLLKPDEIHNTKQLISREPVVIF